MKKLIMYSLLLCCIMFFVAGSAFAKKPTDGNGEYLGNNFPSGPHFNLNIHGKHDNFNCPDPFSNPEDPEVTTRGPHDGEYGKFVPVDPPGTGDYNYECVGDAPCVWTYVDAVDGTHIWKYSGSIFIPELSDDCITIKMQSGNRKSGISDLIIIEPCSGFDCSGKGDDALFELPHNKKGYRVYGRILAKPTNDPTITITPDLSFVKDENNKDLLYLGLVTSDGWETGSAKFTRTKGRSKAIDISGLFKWAGEVCYITDPCAPYIEANEVCPYSVTPKSKCCTYDGATDSYECRDVVMEGGEPYYCDGDVFTDTCILANACAELYDPAYCVQYDDEWIFNIGDLVEYLWDIDNNGSKLLQIRFYPN